MSLATVTFHSIATTTKSGEKNGKPWSITEQDAVIETANMKNRCKISLEKGQAPYEPGAYTFDPAHLLKVSDYGSIQLARDLPLTPVRTAAIKAA